MDAADAVDAVDAAPKVENPMITEVGVVLKVERTIMTPTQTTRIKTTGKTMNGIIRMGEDQTCPHRRASPIW